MVRVITGLLAASVVLALAGCGRAQTSASHSPPPPTRLRVGYASGPYRYGYEAKIRGTQQQANGSRTSVHQDLSAQGKWKVSGAGSGSGDLVTASFSKIHSSQSPTTIPGPHQVIFILSPDGQLTLQKGAFPAPGTPTSAPGTSQFVALLSDQPVKPSSTWVRTISSPNPYGPGGINYQAKSTYVKSTTVHGDRAAEVRTTAMIPINLVVNLQQETGATDQPSPFGTAVEAHYSGSEAMTVTSVIDVPGHQIDSTRSAASVHLAEAPVSGTTPQAPSRFDGTETTSFTWFF
ncbi:MAG: hypothetical protein ACRDXC_01400 [Acidimicrobiales bacterium]